MHQHTVRVTDFDSRRLQSVIAGPRSKDPRDVGSVELLERRLDDAEIIRADRIGPDIVTMNSKVRISDLDTHEPIVFRLVLPNAADAAAGRISVLAPMGMAVLGRRVGDHVTWQTPGGLRWMRVDHILYQPEREGIDLGPSSRSPASGASRFLSRSTEGSGPWGSECGDTSKNLALVDAVPTMRRSGESDGNDERTG